MDLRTSVAPNRLEEFGIYNPFKNGSRVYLTLPGGARQGFTFRPTLAAGFRGPSWNLRTSLHTRCRSQEFIDSRFRRFADRRQWQRV